MIPLFLLVIVLLLEGIRLRLRSGVRARVSVIL